MVLTAFRSPLVLREVAEPVCGKEDVLLEVLACAVCRTDLHIVDGELDRVRLPLILGHQVVGRIVEVGPGVRGFREGDRVGVPWLGGCCGKCRYCLEGQENLCSGAIFTGYDRDGGYAQRCTASYRFIFPLPPSHSDVEAAPLLCAGVIGYRTLRLLKGAKNIAFIGFGAAAHLLTQVVRFQGGQVFAFTRVGDTAKQAFALSLGATWAGDTTQTPPEEIDAAILFAPTGEHYPLALKLIRKGGTVISAGIHMSDIPSFPYKLLSEEKVMRSVTNLTRQDGREFLALAPQIPIKPHVKTYPLSQANDALNALRQGKLQGSAVLIP